MGLVANISTCPDINRRQHDGRPVFDFVRSVHEAAKDTLLTARKLHQYVFLVAQRYEEQRGTRPTYRERVIRVAVKDRIGRFQYIGGDNRPRGVKGCRRLIDLNIRGQTELCGNCTRLAKRNQRAAVAYEFAQLFQTGQADSAADIGGGAVAPKNLYRAVLV